MRATGERQGRRGIVEQYPEHKRELERTRHESVRQQRRSFRSKRPSPFAPRWSQYVHRRGFLDARIYLSIIAWTTQRGESVTFARADVTAVNSLSRRMGRRPKIASHAPKFPGTGRLKRVAFGNY